MWIVNLLLIGGGLRILLPELAVAGDRSHLEFFLTSTPLVFTMVPHSLYSLTEKLFAILVVIYCLHIFSPYREAFGNSKFFSGRPPERRITEKLPHITIQCPIYNESLTGVIVPTVQSLKVAISTYQSQGGTASIFINDDGMQLLDPEMTELRLQYYRDQNIGWVARPPHQKDGFLRAGNFRKVISWKALLKKGVQYEFCDKSCV